MLDSLEVGVSKQAALVLTRPPAMPMADITNQAWHCLAGRAGSPQIFSRHSRKQLPIIYALLRIAKVYQAHLLYSFSHTLFIVTTSITNCLPGPLYQGLSLIHISEPTRPKR